MRYDNSSDQWKSRQLVRESSGGHWEAKPVEKKHGRCSRSNDHKREGFKPREDKSNKTDSYRQKEHSSYGVSIDCFRCMEKGHIAKHSPHKLHRAYLMVQDKEEVLGQGKRDGKNMFRMRLDTGADKTIVRIGRVSSESIRHDCLIQAEPRPMLLTAHGCVHLESPGFDTRMEVAV